MHYCGNTSEACCVISVGSPQRGHPKGLATQHTRVRPLGGVSDWEQVSHTLQYKKDSVTTFISQLPYRHSTAQRDECGEPAALLRPESAVHG